jgi:hypothetical protein
MVPVLGAGEEVGATFWAKQASIVPLEPDSCLQIQPA